MIGSDIGRRAIGPALARVGAGVLARLGLCAGAAGVALGLFAGAATPAAAGTEVVCTVVLDAADGRAIRRDGDCARRATPASTFKIPIALMGFEAGILTDDDTPKWAFRPGYSAWVAAWKQPHTPKSWIRDSVVWYSQEITKRLGARRFAADVAAYGYGNADVSGDPGQHNGLTRAWLSSSLAISPDEQVAFLRRLVGGTLPVKPATRETAMRLFDLGERGDGWRVAGKTGSGPERDAAGRPSSDRAFGWFVGWATKDGRTLVFARLVHDTTRQAQPPGPRTRDGLIADLFPAAR
jgi:beta-lactamase class D